MIDIHTHILPKLDDGARNWDESISMCSKAESLGITHMVATPHLIPGLYTGVIDRGVELLNELKGLLKEKDIDVEVYLAAEIEPFPELIGWLDRGKLPLYPSKKHILLESPSYMQPFWMEEMIFNIISMGITPIIAHPERTINLDIGYIESMVSEGAEVQIDAASLLGLWGRKTEKTAWLLLKEGMVSYVASDSHRPEKRDPELLAKAKNVISKKNGENAAKMLTEINPVSLITIP